MTPVQQPTFPYGFPTSWSRSAFPRCTNAEPGTMGHECSKPAVWVGTIQHPNPNKPDLLSCYCDRCKATGSEAKRCSTWFRMDAPQPEETPEVSK